jgi:hypothetical protein
METRRFVVLVSLATIALAAPVASTTLAGCGGTSDGGVFQNEGIDAGASGSPFDGSLLLATDTAPPVVDAGPCPPAPVTSFKPAWKPPIASKSGACSSAQISDFYDACLGASSVAAGCTAYVQSNATCAACLQSDEGDPEYGPVVWHANRTYYTTNIAGCIADEQSDGGTSGCGAAYQAVVQCKETACTACLSASNPDFARYSACEEDAIGECSAFTTTLTSECGTALKDPTNVVAACIPPATDSAEDAYLRLAPIFCGQ